MRWLERTLTLALVLIVFGACNQLFRYASSEAADGRDSTGGTDPDGRIDGPLSVDAAPRADLTADGMADGAPCAWTPFEAPTLVGGVNSTEDDWVPTLTADELTIYFHSFRGGGRDPDIWVATRASRQDDFSAAVALSQVNTAADESAVRLSFDGQNLTVARDDRLLISTWNGTAFDTFAPLFGDGRLAGWGQLLDGGASIWYVGFPSFGALGGYDIVRATRGSSGGFGPGEAIAELSSTREDFSYALSFDRREVFLSSNRNGRADLDIFHAVDDGSGAFSTPAPVDELNTTGDDIVGFLSPDGGRLYLNQNADTSGFAPGRIQADIARAERACLP